jgi:Phage stabilisation protein
MTAIPIISGISTRGADFSTAYPLNLIPVPKVTGISEGYLRPADGIVSQGVGPGFDRGGVAWNGQVYRVMGERLVRIAANGSVIDIGYIAGANPVTFDNSFDYLAINGGNRLFLYNGATLAEVTDPDLGASLDVIWIDGYFVSTDGEFLVVTELNNPFAVDPLKYGASEINPDPVVALHKIRNEVVALNRFTVEVFRNVGGAGFPFQRIEGAQIQKGVIGSRACCQFADEIAFLGGGFNEPCAVWVGASGQSAKISTREIDDVIKSYPETVLAGAVMESRTDRGHDFLYIHLPDQTIVYDQNGSTAAQQPVWFVLASGDGGAGYRARGMVWCNERWSVGDPYSTAYGYLSDTIASHYGELTTWRFTTPIIHNAGKGVTIHELELIALPGNSAFGDEAKISTSYSDDGKIWSQPKYIEAGMTGNRMRRLVWRRQGSMRNWRAQRFEGDSRAMLSFARLEATMETLNA